MKRISNGSLLWAVCGAIVLVAASAPAEPAAQPELLQGIELGEQPHMETALFLLGKTRTELEKASRDRGGHRLAAIREVTLAADEVEKGIAFSDQHPRPQPRPRAPARRQEALGEFEPIMKNALELLDQAKTELIKAVPDKGGHRLKALGHVNSAIVHVRRGIGFDHHHPRR